MGGDAAKARKVAQLQNDVSALEAALLAAQQEYERVKACNLEVRAGWGAGCVQTREWLGCRFCMLEGRWLAAIKLRSAGQDITYLACMLLSCACGCRSWSARGESGPRSLRAWPAALRR